jgi:hypothetical protein
VVHEIARRKLEKKLQTLADGFADRLAIDHTTDWHGRREDTIATYRRHCSGTVTDRFDGFGSILSHRYRAAHIVPLGVDSSHRVY